MNKSTTIRTELFEGDIEFGINAIMELAVCNTFCHAVSLFNRKYALSNDNERLTDWMR